MSCAWKYVAFCLDFVCFDPSENHSFVFDISVNFIMNSTRNANNLIVLIWNFVIAINIWSFDISFQWFLTDGDFPGEKRWLEEVLILSDLCSGMCHHAPTWAEALLNYERYNPARGVNQLPRIFQEILPQLRQPKISKHVQHLWSRWEMKIFSLKT